jgi:two-component system chemotaxis response regulator CheY
MRILIVDDSGAVRLMVARALRQVGFAEAIVQEAANGVEALQRVRELTPDLVLSDWSMPEMDGMQLLGELRRAGVAVRFGFITSEASQAMREAALAAGASFLLAKPFTPEALEQALRAAR